MWFFVLCLADCLVLCRFGLRAGRDFASESNPMEWNRIRGRRSDDSNRNWNAILDISSAPMQWALMLIGVDVNIDVDIDDHC